jgi:predicted glycoside hydrolase/deacetylase ChbG (UPF0249 family)
VSDRELIVNADDFGRTAGTNAGIIRTHEAGIVTSASLMVRWLAAREAARYARAHPRLTVGLHVDLSLWSQRNDDWVVICDPDAPVEEAIGEQLARFRALVGRDPTHLDSHQHVHRHEPVASILAAEAQRLGLPLRERSTIAYYRDFYGQVGAGHPAPEAIEVDTLIAVIEQLGPGTTELGCHPGLDAELDSSYRGERLREVETLCDPRVRDAIVRERITLRGF